MTTLDASNSNLASVCATIHRAWLDGKRNGESEDAVKQRVMELSNVRDVHGSYPFLFDMAFSDGFRPDYLDEMLSARAAVAAGKRTYHEASVRVGEVFKARFVDPVLALADLVDLADLADSADPPANSADLVDPATSADPDRIV